MRNHATAPERRNTPAFRGGPIVLADGENLIKRSDPCDLSRDLSPYGYIFDSYIESIYRYVYTNWIERERERVSLRRRRSLLNFDWTTSNEKKGN